MNWYLKCWRQYADFSGRARRTEYWMFQVFNVLIVFVAAIFAGLLITLTQNPDVIDVFAVLLVLYYLAMFIPALAVLVRRLHDTGKSGAWIFIAFVPIIGSFWLLILLFTEGAPASNEYGPDPKATGIPTRQNAYEATNREQPYGEYERRATQPAHQAQQAKISIGRDYSCDIRVDDSFADVSRNHAAIIMEGGILMFEDNSTNGSSINGQPLHHARWMIHQGDRIVLGKNYTLSWNDINRFFRDDSGTRKTNRFI
jgi:uncharacterized membrane protein YhaH (DUF805 family)